MLLWHSALSLYFVFGFTFHRIFPMFTVAPFSLDMPQVCCM
jgi:hypothetical protein